MDKKTDIFDFTSEYETRDPDQMPEIPPCFHHINRYWDTRNNCFAAKLKPGEFYVSHSGELITTILGSCVAACIRDTRLGIGGMNHIMLPNADRYSRWKETPVSLKTRYGNIAMESLINFILSNGGKRENLEIKIFGGAALFNFIEDVGKKNIEFVRMYLIKEGFKITSEDVGGRRPRKIHYYPVSGRARVKQIASMHNQTLYEREQEYLTSVTKDTLAGKVEIFNESGD